jgi:DNA (cytosine-5)-methyltransferase 1
VRVDQQLHLDRLRALSEGERISVNLHRPRLIDLFCGAGGCSVGYHRAGFDVVGVDIDPHPDYPFEFHQADALEFPLEGFDAIHASPPCQAYSTMGQKHAETQAAHPALVAPIRGRLRAAGVPYVIENVMGARRELDHPIMLCGRALGLGVARHRLFECSFACFATQCACRGDELPVYGKLDGRRVWTRTDGSELRAARTLEQASEAMGIDWMVWDDLTQAIPPAYTEHVGHYLMAALTPQEAAA